MLEIRLRHESIQQLTNLLTDTHEFVQIESLILQLRKVLELITLGSMVANHELYEILYQDSGFCAGLGRAMMTAARLESVLRRFLRRQDVAVR
jgi:hypothetical protein